MTTIRRIIRPDSGHVKRHIHKYVYLSINALLNSKYGAGQNNVIELWYVNELCFTKLFDTTSILFEK